MDYATGKIVNATTMEPIPQASIRVVSKDHIYLGDGVAADNEGKFRLDSNFLIGDNLLEISSVGFATVYISPENFAMYNVLGLYTQAETLEAVTVTADKDKSNGLLLVGGALGLALIIGDNKKQKPAISGPGGAIVATSLLNDPVIKYVAIGGAIIVLANVFGIMEDILEALGLKKSKDSGELDETADNPQSWWSPTFYKSAPAGTRVLLLSTASANAMAKAIYDAFGAFNDNEEQAIGIFKQLKTRSQGSFLVERFNQLYNSDLLTFLRGATWPEDRLSDSDVNTINQFVNKLPKYDVA
jgi:hypothetical protein